MATKVPCPKCREKGGDTAGDNLTIYPGNGAHCHACGFNLTERQLKQYQETGEIGGKVKRNEQDTQLELSLIRERYPYGTPHKTYLDPVICEKSGVKYSVDEEGYAEAVYYPYYKDGEVVDYKKRRLPKDFYCITGKINKAELFGQHLIPEDRRGLLIIVEGEDDKLAADQMFQQLGKSYSVVSLPNGANESGKVDECVRRQVEFITSFKKVALCLDNDDPGQATAQGIAELIAPMVEVRLMELPRKDADEMLKHNEAHIFLERLNNAKKFNPEGVVEGSSVDLLELQTPSQPGLELPYPRLHNKLHGLRKGEITLLCAGTGIGKTTLAREVAYHLVTAHNQTIGNIYLEEQWKKTAQGYIAIDNNIPLPHLRIRPDALTHEQWQASHHKFYGLNKVHFFKHFGSVASDRLINKCRYFALGLGADYIILDHVTMVMSGNETHDERKDIDILMTRLAELVTETGVGVIAVVHLKRTGKELSFNEGAEVSLTDLRGSSQLEALSWNVIALERDQQSQSAADVSTIRLLKNREWGYTGLCDKLVYDHQTGRLLPVQREL